MLKRLFLMGLTVILLAACGAEVESGEPEAEADPVADPQPVADPEAADINEGDELIVYAGRTEDLVGPLLERYEEIAGIEVGVRYGDTASLAATILEEGRNSPADVYFAQDAGALGALAAEGRLLALPDDILNSVDSRFHARDGLWVAVSGRARVVAYNTNNVDPDELPDSIFGFADPEWAGRIGWPPANGSFQAFVTGMRQLEGDDATRAWLEAIVANEPIDYASNAVALQGVAAGEVDVAFINHYYLFRALAEQGEDFPAANYFLPGGDPGALINVAGAGVVDTTDNEEAAEDFLRFLLSEEAQTYFTEQTYEYPLVMGIEADPRLPALEDLDTPDIDLSNLADLAGTLQMLQEVGALD